MDTESPWPIVSVITATYNRGRFLRETIDSVLAQDYPCLDVIVLDDGSTDDTPDILHSYGDRIRWDSHPNMGQAATINRGVDMARGNFFSLVSSDDPLLPDAIAILAEALAATPDAGLVYPDYLQIDEDGEPMATVRSLPYNYVDMVRLHHCYPGPGGMIRRTAWDEVGGWDPSFRYVPDFDFYLRLGPRWNLLHVPHVLATWRVHHDSITIGELGEGMAADHIRVIQKVFERDDLPEEVRSVRTEALKAAFFVAGVALDPTLNHPSYRFELIDRLGKPIDHVDRGPASSDPQDIILWLRREVTKRDEAAAALHASVAQELKKLGNIQQGVAEHVSTINWLHAEVAKRDATVEWLHREVAQRDATAEQLHREVAERDRLIEALRGGSDGMTDSTPSSLVGDDYTSDGAPPALPDRT